MAAGMVSLMPRWQTSKTVLVFGEKKKILLEALMKTMTAVAQPFSPPWGNGREEVTANMCCFCSQQHSGVKGSYPSISPWAQPCVKCWFLPVRLFWHVGQPSVEVTDHRWLSAIVSEIKKGDTERNCEFTGRHVWLHLWDSGLGSSFLSQAALLRDVRCLWIRVLHNLNQSHPFPFWPSSISIPTSHTPFLSPLRHG